MSSNLSKSWIRFDEVVIWKLRDDLAGWFSEADHVESVDGIVGAIAMVILRIVGNPAVDVVGLKRPDRIELVKRISRRISLRWSSSWISNSGSEIIRDNDGFLEWRLVGSLVDFVLRILLRWRMSLLVRWRSFRWGC